MCYTVPLAVSAITTLKWKKKKSVKLWWLNLLLYGASAFGVIDHLYNGELFLISANLGKDLFLGVLITLFVFLLWGIILHMSKVNTTISKYIVE